MSNFGQSGAPSTLYHYCDAHAFESIVRTNQLWLCPFVYSNDTMEGQACRDVLRRLAEGSSMATHSIGHFLSQIDFLRGILECYGVSLSEEADLLSQWRGYAADGAGFAIGFDRGLLNEMPELRRIVPAEDTPMGLGPHLVKVEYEEPQASERLRGLFESARQHILTAAPANMLAGLSQPDALEAARVAINNTLFYQWNQLFSIKGPAFREEREWRLAFTGFPDVPIYQYRVSRGMLAPYVKYDMPKVADGRSPIAHVVIGSKNPTPQVVVEAFLRKYGHHECRVTVSASTYR